MNLNHINLTVTEVTEAANFLEKYFGLHNLGGNNGFMGLSDDNGLILTLMKTRRTEADLYPETFHIGFGQESKEQVNQLYQRLKDDGFDVKPPEQHYAWTFYVQASGGFTVEIFA